MQPPESYDESIIDQDDEDDRPIKDVIRKPKKLKVPKANDNGEAVILVYLKYIINNHLRIKSETIRKKQHFLPEMRTRFYILNHILSLLQILLPKKLCSLEVLVADILGIQTLILHFINLIID